MEVEFKNVMDNKNIIDIRSQIDFEEYNIKDSLNIPRMKLLGNPEKYLEKTTTYYLLCDNGKTSLSSVKILNALGYTCYSIKGGIDYIYSIK